MDDKDYEIVGFFLRNPGATRSEMVYRVTGDLQDLYKRVDKLVADGILKPSGFAAHTETYRVIGGQLLQLPLWVFALISDNGFLR